jgi:DNA (cytosine-5)-methyltransferase 1
MSGTTLLQEPTVKRNLDTELVIDNFAGGGGASLGISMALGRGPDYAINHDKKALAMHKANHPNTEHLREDVWKVKPGELCAGRPVGLAWFSPDCRHFSAAKGGRPVSKRVRGLAWVVIKWAKAVRPRVIILENVREFQTWGPLVQVRDEDGRVMKDARGVPLELPCPDRKGDTFRRWKNQLVKLGYKVEFQMMDAAEYGAPTHRRRFFLVARCDGKPINWPAPTHGDPESDEVKSGKLQPWKTAASCIDWSVPCPSIFLTNGEGKAIGVKRPLAANTLRRIANGIKRYVIDKKEPFIVRMGHYSNITGEGDGFRGQSTDKPLGTACSTNDKALVIPIVTPVQNSSVPGAGHDAAEPLRTITAHPKGGGFALTTARLMHVNHSGEEDRSQDLNQPLPTVTSKNGFALVSAFLAKHFGGMVGVGIDTPFPTITQIPTQNQIVTAMLTKFRGTCKDGQAIDQPAPSVAAQGNHEGLVTAFLTTYYGQGIGQPVDEPMRTVTTKDRFTLVMIQGTPYAIVDIGMRMLTPRELARCQGFPESYDLHGVDGKLTKTDQVAKIGNSVCPVMGKVLVEANYVYG